MRGDMTAPDPVADERYMREAMIEAACALEDEEVPVGALIVCDGEIIARGRNTTRRSACALGHAEIDVIAKACAHFHNERLCGCELYVTKEPCTMCAGAIIHARIARVIIGARDTKYGACGTVFDIAGNQRYNHVPALCFGVLEKDCAAMLSDFFGNLRTRKKPARSLNDD